MNTTKTRQVFEHIGVPTRQKTNFVTVEVPAYMKQNIFSW